MKIEAKLKFKSYLKYQLFSIYRKPILILFNLGAIFTISLFIYDPLEIIGQNPNYFPFIINLVILILLPLMVFLSTKRNFSTNSTLKEKITYEFTDDKLIITGESFFSQLEWKNIFKIKEKKNWILIYHNNHIANLIPKSSFGELLPEFKELIKNKTNLSIN